MRRHIALLALGLAAAVPLSAAAGPYVGINVPGLSIQFGNPGWGVAVGTPYYRSHAPQYYAPAPVYGPAPVYYERPVYYAPPVRYVAPRAVIVAPRYGHGYGHGNGYGNRYGHGPGRGNWDDRRGDSRHWR